MKNRNILRYKGSVLISGASNPPLNNLFVHTSFGVKCCLDFAKRLPVLQFRTVYISWPFGITASV